MSSVRRQAGQGLVELGINPATPVVIVNVTGCVPYLMNIFALGTPCGGGARGFNVNRSVWFRDERRG